MLNNQESEENGLACESDGERMNDRFAAEDELQYTKSLILSKPQLKLLT